MDIVLVRNALLWCFIINTGILTFWFLFMVLAHDFVYRMHSKLFKVSEENFDAIHYAGIMFYKIFIFTLFLVPYLALCITG